jgi:hypothetical protein
MIRQIERTTTAEYMYKILGAAASAMTTEKRRAAAMAYKVRTDKGA